MKVFKLNLIFTNAIGSRFANRCYRSMFMTFIVVDVFCVRKG